MGLVIGHVGIMTDQDCTIDRLLTQVNDKLLESGRVVIAGDEKVAELREKEFDLIVAKVSKLCAEDIDDADMIGISPVVDIRASLQW